MNKTSMVNHNIVQGEENHSEKAVSSISLLSQAGVSSTVSWQHLTEWIHNFVKKMTKYSLFETSFERKLVYNNVIISFLLYHLQYVISKG